MVQGAQQSSPLFWSSAYTKIIAHHTFKLGYTIILRNLKESKDSIENDLPNFLGYCQAWATSIVVHHDSEVHLNGYSGILLSPPFLRKRLFSHF